MDIYERMDRWVDHCQRMGWEIKRVLIHPDDIDALKVNGVAVKTHRGLPIVALASYAYGG